MANIKIPRKLDPATFLRLSKTYDQNRHVSIELPTGFTEAEYRDIFTLLLSQLPNELALLTLANLAELDDVPIDLLEELFDKGDTGCKVTICLRQDLNESLRDKCRNSSDSEVREHYSLAIGGRPSKPA
jgi:hypothetical protein